jgi:hypothetical protein
MVQERLGHSGISLTLNTCSYVLRSIQEEAAEKMDKLLVPIEVSETQKKSNNNHQHMRELFRPCDYELGLGLSVQYLWGFIL